MKSITIVAWRSKYKLQYLNLSSCNAYEPGAQILTKSRQDNTRDRLTIKRGLHCLSYHSNRIGCTTPKVPMLHSIWSLRASSYKIGSTSTSCKDKLGRRLQRTSRISLDAWRKAYSKLLQQRRII
ncbi:hypothetical protein L1987_07028 [Smallanthus sonchifolius]|uniref:Uncharacterized protein n=1 Tax=Smallanthus sonchifolius TaxID=185202 RepID=A0ACB9JZR8_9ASTR|nr:hypothetical protein L1987_07028 [Smallanthus sonchifolius]